MHTRRVADLTIRPLRSGDTATILALFERLGDQSRTQRFGGAKPRLSEAELASRSRVDDSHHVLVAYVDGDPKPAGIARLARDGDGAEVAYAVADVHQRRGIGSVLARELAADARAAGIRELRATVRGDNQGVVSLITRYAKLVDTRWCAGEREFVAAL